MTSVLAAGPETFLAAFVFAMIRPGAAFLVAPVFSSLGLPVRARILLAAGAASAVLGAANLAPPPILSVVGFAAVLGEAFVGLALGFILQLALAGALLAGEQVAATAGLGFAAFADPQSGAASPVVGQFLSLVALLLFLAADGHLALVEAVVRSHAVLPAGAFPSAGRVLEIVRFGGSVFATGFMIAAPVAAALFAVNLSLAVLTRAAPQMNIFAVGLPVAVLAAMTMLALAFPAIVALLQEAIRLGTAMLDVFARG